MADAEPLRKQAWDYFALHAQQRLTTLHFYLLIATALVAATVASFQKDFQLPRLRGVAGFLLALLSFVFWRIDVRTRALIEGAENALSSFELSGRADDWSGELPPEFLFANDRRARERRKARRGWRDRLWPASYTEAIEMLFAVFFAAGVLSLLFAVIG